MNSKINQIQKDLIEKKISAVEFVEVLYRKIKKVDQQLGAFLELTEELAYAQAEKIDELIAHNQPLPKLAGIPIAIKDNILVKNYPCTAGSKILSNYIAPYDATVIEKLKSAGAIIIGKTNLDEFAMGSSTETSAFKLTKNPHDPKRVPGGSSGGSAAIVGSGLIPLALGSDTGGSIRQPSAFCGIVGLKPTYGAVSRYGLIAMASSLDQIGPMAQTVQDCEKLFEVIIGQDPKDSTSQNFHFQKGEPERAKNYIIGLPKEYFEEGLDEKIKQKILQLIEILKKEGIKIKEISLPMTKYSLACYYLIVPAEVSANLARYDSIRYGLQARTKNLLEKYFLARGKFLGKEVKRRIFLGTFVLSHGYYSAYYLKAQKVRTLISEDFQKAFKEVDLIVGPTSPVLPFKFGEKLQDPLSMYLSDIYTVSVNLAGLPALSLNIGFINEENTNLPVGLQIIGNYFQEEKIFSLAKFIEQYNL